MIYFDNSATTKIDPEALETYQVVSQKIFGNPSSLHGMGDQAAGLLRQARKQIAEDLGVAPEEIYFTSGGSEGDNWAIKGTALEKMNYGRHIITSAIEHPAVRETMKQVEKFGFEVTVLPVDGEGRVRVQDLENAIRDDTILVSIMAVNNEVGSIQPIDEIGQVLEKYPTIHFHVDAVQSVGRSTFKLGQDSRVDMAVYSAHKFNGPRGVGFMYLKKGRRIQPLISGGGQEAKERSGTENLPAIAAMSKAFRKNLEKAPEDSKQLRDLQKQLRDHLEAKDKVEIFTPLEGAAPHILCFGILGIRGEVVVHALEKEGIFVSTTSACSSRSGVSSSTLGAMGVSDRAATSAIRVSLGKDNTQEEMTTFIQAFDKVYDQFANIL